jgi:hypothetical protein
MKTNLEKLYAALEQDNNHSTALLVQCVIRGRVDLYERAAYVALRTLLDGELTDVTGVAYSDVYAALKTKPVDVPRIENIANI